MTPEPSPTRPGRRYSTFVGIAFLVLVVVATLNTIRTEGGEQLDRAGTPLPEFAVPDARSGPLDRDAAIFQDDCSTSENPCPSDAGRTPACEIDVEGAIRVCDLFDRPLVISFWFTRAADCLPTQDSLDRVARQYRGRVNFLSSTSATIRRTYGRSRRTMVGGSRWATTATARSATCIGWAAARRWSSPTPAGSWGSSKVGGASEGEITEAVQRLLRESRARAATPR